MIQLNLVPDVKSKYISAQRKKRTVILSAITVGGVALGIVVLMASYVYLGQKVQLSLLENDIKSNTEKLKKIDGLDKILTIQNQLNVMTDLHSQKPVTTRLFTFLPQITPNDVKIANLDLSYDDGTMQISGTAKSLEAVNKFVDTIKFTDYTTDQNQDKKRAFSSVVLSSFSTSDTDTSYTIALKYDPAIFSRDSKTVSLVVPKITSTRSQTEQPGALFESKPDENQQTGGNR
jgi:Tfp pilus assembly protein PilN